MTPAAGSLLVLRLKRAASYMLEFQVGENGNEYAIAG